MTMRMHSFTSPSTTLEKTSSPSASLFRQKGRRKSCQKITFSTSRSSRNRPRSVFVLVVKAKALKNDDAKNSFKRRDLIKTNAKKKGGGAQEQKFDWENDFDDDFVPAGKAKKNKKKQTPAKAAAPPSPLPSTPPSTPPPPPSPTRREREVEEREEVKETPAVAEEDAVAAQATTGQADEEEEEEEEDEFAKKKRLAQEKKAALLEAKKREYELAQKEAKEMAEQATMAQAKREEEERASAAAAAAEQTEQAEKEREEEEIRAVKEKDAAEKAKVLADAAKAKEAAAAAATAAAAAPAAQTTTNETEEKPTTQKKNKEDYMIPEHLKDIFSNDKKRSLKRTAGAVTTGVRVENIKKTFTQQEVLTDVTWDCKKGERVGLVGWNGAGKTTQLKIIMGEIEQDEGEVLLANNVKIGYLTQEFEVKGTNTVREEFLASFGDESEVLKNLERVQKALEDNPSAELTQLLVDKLNELQRQADRMDLFNMERLIDKIMPELGFVPEDNDRLVSSFSGGWQMRISVGKILLQEPGLLLLDEPTNHIDLNTIQWLESYLKNVDVPLVCVSHDREFLDQICNKIVEVERGVATTYKGNYSDYRREKETKAMQTYVAWEKWNKEVSRQRELIQRLAGGGQSGRATAAQKALDKLMEDPIMKPWEEKSRRFRFPDAPRSSQIVAQVRGLSHGYDEKTLFQNVNLQIDRSERVAMIGDNGCGKSTMMRLIQGKEAPKAGEARLGDKELCKVNYFYQNQAEDLDGDVGVLETLVRAAPDEPLNQLKALLGRMAFNTSYHDRPVNFLSGGEKARLALAKFMVTPANVLFLDEPTNHLDIPSKQMLEEALQSFEGTVLAISHDRFFLRQIATRVLAFDEGKITDYEGDYAYYLSKNDKAGSRDQILTAKKKEIEKTQIVSKSKMSKAEKAKLKKEKAKAFGGGSGQAKVNKNAGRWN
ncbi:unnamed protein product [Bathycoccus prasinos]